MQPRIINPALMVPEALQSLIAFSVSVKKLGVPQSTHDLVHLRASQINGCSVCIEMHSRDIKKSAVEDEKLWAVAGWRDAPYFSDAERAALALTEAVTRMSDQEDAVPDSVWDEAARHYDQQGLAALMISIASINVWNRLNVATRQVAGSDRA